MFVATNRLRPALFRPALITVHRTAAGPQATASRSQHPDGFENWCFSRLRLSHPFIPITAAGLLLLERCTHHSKTYYCYLQAPGQSPLTNRNAGNLEPVYSHNKARLAFANVLVLETSLLSLIHGIVSIEEFQRACDRLSSGLRGNSPKDHFIIASSSCAM